MSSYDLEILGIDPTSALSSASRELEDLLTLNDPAVMSRRSHHFSILGTTEDDYAEKFYRLDSDQAILAGIRHLSADPSHPFVHLMLPFAPKNSDLLRLAEFARSTFWKFAPKHLSFSARPRSASSNGLTESGAEFFVARNHVVGRVTELRKLQVPAGFNRISFEPFDFTKSFSWYEKAYADFHLSNPQMKPWVPITDAEDLRDCVRDGWIFQVRVDGQVAGLVAARKEGFLGGPGAYMTELLLTEPFKGCRLASAVQRKFVNELEDGVEFIWGTIDARNQPSMKTALSLGRQVIRSEYFLKL